MSKKRVLYYFRKDLRLLDHPALVEALKLKPDYLTPIFILDSHYVTTARCGINRWTFLLESLENLDKNLRKYGTRLLVLRGDPMQILPCLYRTWGITHLYHEIDTEPFWQFRDQQIKEFSKAFNVQVKGVHGHTLYDPIAVVRANGGKPPLSIRSFQKAILNLPHPPVPLKIEQVFPKQFPDIGDIALPTSNTNDDDQLFINYPIDKFTRPTFDPIDKEKRIKLFSELSGPSKNYSVPTISELAFIEPTQESDCSPHKGGEDVALRLLDTYFADKLKTAMFEKPKTSPASFNPASTTVLSPHLKFGTLSSRVFYHRLMEIYSQVKKHSEPPVSLLGQLYWREFYYAVAAVAPDYHKMKGNPVCLQVDWWCQDGPEDPKNLKAAEHLKAWANGMTGYPWIDAIMRQLRKEGWIHHLARHSVACFLTRGDLFISWERGAEVFEEFLLDHDSALNIGNWLWLRVYSPVAFAKQWDKEGKYIKKYVPELKNMPTQYTFEPWTAPIAVQKKIGCIIGQDYPKPIVDHSVVSKENMAKMKEAYQKGEKGVVNAGSAWYGPMAVEFLKSWGVPAKSIPEKRKK